MGWAIRQRVFIGGGGNRFGVAAILAVALMVCVYPFLSFGSKRLRPLDLVPTVGGEAPDYTRVSFDRASVDEDMPQAVETRKSPDARTRGAVDDFLQEYLTLLEKGEPTQLALEELLTRVDTLISDDMAFADLVLHLVSLHGNSVPEQWASVHAVGLLRRRCSATPQLYNVLAARFHDAVFADPLDRSERVVHVLSQVAKVGFMTGYVQESVTDNFFEAYTTTDDGLLRAQLLMSMPGTGDDELALVAIESEMYSRDRGGSELEGVLLAVSAYSIVARRLDFDQRRVVADSIVQFSDNASDLSVVEWSALWKLVGQNSLRLEEETKDSYAKRLLDYKSGDAALQRFIDLKRAAYKRSSENADILRDVIQSVTGE